MRVTPIFEKDFSLIRKTPGLRSCELYLKFPFRVVISTIASAEIGATYC